MWYEIFFQTDGKPLFSVPWKWLAHFITALDRRLDYALPDEGW